MTIWKANSAERTNTKKRHDTDTDQSSVEVPPLDDVVVAQNNAKKETTAKMQKVPQLLRNNASHGKCYDPIVLSIGPYHHGKAAFQEVEDLKPGLKDKFVKDSGKNVDDFYNKMVEVADEARDCYAQGSMDKPIDDEKFKQMMLLDGCFILQFIHCFVDDKHEELEMKLHIVPYVVRDLLLLENQLPFIVLKALMRLRFEKEPAHGMRKIHKFIRRCRSLPTPDQDLSKFKGPFVHLIDIMVRQLIEPSAFQKNVNPEPDNGPSRRWWFFRKTESNDENDYWISYRSAKELTMVGIHLRKGNSYRFTDVHFNSHLLMATLTLPPIAVDDSTKAKLLNMVAYETCPDSPNDYGVTSYICFLDSLIDNAEDVKELRSKGILLNKLGSDEHVAQLFNEITNDLVPHPLAFEEVNKQIEKHYRNRAKKWIAAWIHEHFSTPWTFLAFAGAILAISLSVLQTYFAANPPK